MKKVFLTTKADRDILRAKLFTAVMTIMIIVVAHNVNEVGF